MNALHTCELRAERAVNREVILIADYDVCNRDRRIYMSDSALQAHSIFNERPSVQFIEGWHHHISVTGEPETYKGVSTSKPERSARVVLLSDDIRIPTALRPGGERVPCPLCSPTSPKFGKGRMAYFPDDFAVRFIGNHCAKRYLGDSYTEAEKLFRIEAKCREYQSLWPRLQEKLPLIDPIVQRLYGSGNRLSELRGIVDIQAPGFCSFLHNDLVARGSRVITSRDVGAKTYPVEGVEFLSLDFDPRISVEKLMFCCRDIRKPLPKWAVSDGDCEASKEIIRRGTSLVRHLKGMSALRDAIEDAAQFLKRKNLRLLEQWRATGASPFSILTFKFDEDRIETLAESYAGRFNWSVVAPPDLISQLPTKEQISSLGLSEMMT
jgi:hypothetical protein